MSAQIAYPHSIFATVGYRNGPDDMRGEFSTIQGTTGLEYVRKDLLPSPAADYVAGLEADDPIAWLPTETVNWLLNYDGPACATKTAAHNKPIKTDGGVAVYLHPKTQDDGLGDVVDLIAQMRNEYSSKHSAALDQVEMWAAQGDLREVSAASSDAERHGASLQTASRILTAVSNLTRPASPNTREPHEFYGSSRTGCRECGQLKDHPFHKIEGGQDRG